MIGAENDFMWFPGYFNIDINTYADSLMSMVLSSIAISRWRIIHEGMSYPYALDYEDFVACFAYMVPERLFDDVLHDFEVLMAHVYEDWQRLDYPEVILPMKFQSRNNFYVFELAFGDCHSTW